MPEPSQAASSSESYFGLKEAAEEAGIHEMTLRAYIRDGKISPLHDPNYQRTVYRFSPKDIEEIRHLRHGNGKTAALLDSAESSATGTEEEWITITDAASELGTSYLNVYNRVHYYATEIRSRFAGRRRMVARSELPRLKEMIFDGKHLTYSAPGTAPDEEPAADKSFPSASVAAKETLSVKETAAELGVPAHIIYYWIEDGKIEARVVDGKKTIPRSGLPEIRELLLHRKNGGEAPSNGKPVAPPATAKNDPELSVSESLVGELVDGFIDGAIMFGRKKLGRPDFEPPSMQAAREKYERALGIKEADIKTLLEELAEYRGSGRKTADYEKIVERLSDEVAKYKARMSELEARLAERPSGLKAHLTASKDDDEVRRLKKLVGEYEERIERLNGDLRSYRAQMAEYSAIADEGDSLRVEIANLRARIRMLDTGNGKHAGNGMLPDYLKAFAAEYPDCSIKVLYDAMVVMDHGADLGFVKDVVGKSPTAKTKRNLNLLSDAALTSEPEEFGRLLDLYRAGSDDQRNSLLTGYFKAADRKDFLANPYSVIRTRPSDEALRYKGREVFRRTKAVDGKEMYIWAYTDGQQLPAQDAIRAEQNYAKANKLSGTLERVFN